MTDGFMKISNIHVDFVATRTVFTVGVFVFLNLGCFELFRRDLELAGAAGSLTVAEQSGEFVAKHMPKAELAYNWHVPVLLDAGIRGWMPDQEN